MRYAGKVLSVTGLVSLSWLIAGCSGTSAAITGGRMLWNVSRDSSNLRVLLDGQEGKQNKLKKAWKGPKGARFVIKEQVSTSPIFNYTLKNPDEFGRIAGVSFAIHQEFESDFSHLAEFVVYGKDNKSESQLKPDTDYDLSNLHENFKIVDHRGDPVDKVALKSGLQYRIVLTVRADASDTILVEFETN